MVTNSIFRRETSSTIYKIQRGERPGWTFKGNGF
jgi:hypothetical protein